MSDCPSTSLVRMPSKRVAWLCQQTIDRCIAGRAARLEPFEEKIAAEIARRQASKRRWFRKSADRDTVTRDLCRDDWGWNVQFSIALEAYKNLEKRAYILLGATAEADEVWVSAADLWLVTP